MPGYLIPADLNRIIPPDANPFTWAVQSLLASPGAVVARGGQCFRIPTLVPAVRHDGTCIHYTAGGRCAIYDVAPFGCRFFDHNTPPASVDPNDISRQGLIAIIEDCQQDGPYCSSGPTYTTRGRSNWRPKS